MHAALLNQSRFLKSQEFKGKDVTLTITKVELEELESEDSTKKLKGVISFAETPKLLVVNRTNTDCLKTMFGVETDNWIGKRVTLYPEPFKDPFTKENTTATRVRGSPDISGNMSVSIKMRKKKPQVRNLVKTGQVGPLSMDELANELKAILDLIEATDPAECDTAWNGGLGSRINRLPATEKQTAIDAFKARKRVAPTEAPPSEPF